LTAALPAPQGPAGAGHLAAVLKQNGTPLRLLSMRRNAIGDDGAAAFAAALETNTALDTLILAQNGISDGGGKKKIRGLRRVLCFCSDPLHYW
jgi:nucleotide-binding oligomerization domain-containing protein 1